MAQVPKPLKHFRFKTELRSSQNLSSSLKTLSLAASMEPAGTRHPDGHSMIRSVGRMAITRSKPARSLAALRHSATPTNRFIHTPNLERAEFRSQEWIRFQILVLRTRLQHAICWLI